MLCSCKQLIHPVCSSERLEGRRYEVEVSGVGGTPLFLGYEEGIGSIPPHHNIDRGERGPGP